MTVKGVARVVAAPRIQIFKQPSADTPPRSRRTSARGLLHRPAFRDRRAQGMPGARSARGLVCKVESTRVRNHGHAGITRHSPRNGFNGFLRALPGDRAFLSPSSLRSLLLKNLTPASRRQDHTTSPSASSRSRQKRASRPPHPAPNVRDDRETPLVGTGRRRI
jgi:hypothetical protein